MSNFETVVRDVDRFVGDFISKLPTKQLAFGCVWVFFLIYLWARVLGAGLLLMDIVAMLWVIKNAYLLVKSVQELWKRLWKGTSD